MPKEGTIAKPINTDREGSCGIYAPYLLPVPGVLVVVNLGSLRKRPGKAKIDPDAAKTPISIRLDGAVLADLRSEAERLGIPYQTLISSVLHRYVKGELADPKAIDLGRIVVIAS